MPVITLPDGSQRSYAGPVTVAQVAADIARASRRRHSRARWTAGWSTHPTASMRTRASRS